MQSGGGDGGSYSVVMEGKVILVREIIPTRNNNVK